MVVYKIDRLSRSLAQFSRLMDIFDRHAVRLLSVSQHLDSQHPEGRLVINALMAFAQFERELTSERQLHKIRTTRRAGCGRAVQARWGMTQADSGLSSTNLKQMSRSRSSSDSSPYVR